MSEHTAKRVEALIRLTESLTALIAAECRAFEARRPQDAAKTLEETTRLANIYRHESARIRADSSLIAGAPMVLRVQLIRATEAFDSVLHRHGRALEAARVVTEGLVRAVANEVVSQRKTGAGYGPGAQATQANASAVTLNRSA